MDREVLISVIVPFYKGNQYIKQLFECIEKNAKKISQRVELLLVNDSPDCEIIYYPEWVKSFDLNILVNEKNNGIQKTRVNGLFTAKGKYVIFLDQDDLLADNAFETHLRYIGDDDIVVGNGINENRERNYPIYKSLKHQKLVSSLRMYLNVGCMIVSPGQCMIKKESIPIIWTNSIIKKNGADDYFLWLLMLSKNLVFSINPNIIYTHVDTGENLSSNFESMINSSNEVLDLLLEMKFISKKEKNRAVQRFEMRRIYEGKNYIFFKIYAFLMHPILAIDLFYLAIQRQIQKY